MGKKIGDRPQKCSNKDILASRVVGTDAASARLDVNVSGMMDAIHVRCRCCFVVRCFVRVSAVIEGARRARSML